MLHVGILMNSSGLLAGVVLNLLCFITFGIALVIHGLRRIQERPGVQGMRVFRYEPRRKE